MTERLSTTVPSMNSVRLAQLEWDETTEDDKKGARARLKAEIEAFHREMGGFDPDPEKMLETAGYIAEAFAPNQISMDPGIKEEMVDAVRTGRPIVFCPNHVRAEDQYVLVAALMTQEEEEFKAILAHLRIMAKVEYLEGQDNKAIGFAPDELIPLGALPVIRPRRDPEAADMAKEPFNEMMMALMERENHFVGFYESTRNQTTDPHTVQRVRQGAGHLAVRSVQFDQNNQAAQPEAPRPLFIPIGISYTPYVDAKYAPANIHFGTPITFGLAEEREKISKDALIQIFTINLQTGMQDAVDQSLPIGQMPLFNIPPQMRS